MGMVKQHWHETLTELAAAGDPDEIFDFIQACVCGDNMIPASFIPQVKTWKFGAAQGDGEVKSFPVSCGGMDIVLSIQGCLSPFNASSLNDSARKTLTLRLPQVWDGPFGEMEAALMKEAADHSPALFGEKLSEDQLLERYKPLTKKTGEYPRQLKAKMNTNGFYAVRFWNSERIRVDAPSDCGGLLFNAVLKIRAMWVSAEAFGLVCDATDLQLLESAQVECPF